MKRFRFLAASCAGTLIYVLISLVGGKDGFWAQKQLEQQKMLVSAHTASIQKTTDELKLECLALEKDNDVIAAYARKLGYVGEGEKLVKISGLAAKETQIFDPGTVIKYPPVKYIPEWICKVMGLIVFSLVYVIVILSDYNNGLLTMPSKRKRSEVRGIVSYDVAKM